MALLSGGISPFTKVIDFCNIFSTGFYFDGPAVLSDIFFCLDQSDHEVVCLVFSDLILGKRQYVRLCFIVLSYTSHLLLLGKSEYTGGPIFKVVLEC